MALYQIPILSDSKGYIDRECPNPKCLYIFKVLLKDWEKIFSHDKVHCPLCGYVDSRDNWWTQEQIKTIQNRSAALAQHYAQQELNRFFKNLNHTLGTKRGFKINYAPPQRISFINNYIYQRKEWETEICCEKCGAHYSVIGAAFFCPCCGYYSAEISFSDSLDSIEKMLESFQEIKKTMEVKSSKDVAETMCRNMLEHSIGNIVSAFQKFASCKYEELTKQPPRVNDFQILKKGSELFENATGKKYNEFLSDSELHFMSVMFQRRHILEHNNGMIDQKYLDNSHDTSYSIGQRVVVKKTEVYRLLEIVRKLGNGLLTISKRDDAVETVLSERKAV